MDVDPQQNVQVPDVETPKSTTDKQLVIELSSISDTESCWAYFTHKMELLGAKVTITVEDDDELSERGKASVSDPAHVIPGLSDPEVADETAEDVPVVTFLETSTPPVEPQEASTRQTLRLMQRLFLQ